MASVSKRSWGAKRFATTPNLQLLLPIQHVKSCPKSRFGECCWCGFVSNRGYRKLVSVFLASLLSNLKRVSSEKTSHHLLSQFYMGFPLGVMFKREI